MGVLGLTPFLQKTCPQIIHRLPNRLRDLTGKKLVIDGTLITQRFHYGPSPQSFRHVLGWYNLAREMNLCEVSAICIFDGQQRNRAKADELMRRKELRKLGLSRGMLELSRARRLQNLKSIVDGLETMDDEGQQHIAQVLQSLDSHTDASAVNASRTLDKIGEQLRLLEESSLTSAVSDMPDEAAQKLEEYNPPSRTAPSMIRPQDLDFMPLPQEGPKPALPLLEDIKTMLLTSYREFKSSLSKVASLPFIDPSSSQASISVARQESDVQEDVQEDIVLSRTQCQMTLEESRVWNELTLASSSRGNKAAIDSFVLNAASDRLDALAERSELIADSYQRRMSFPTRTTYIESMEILEAMGIPCYEIEGLHEGEALASSLVHHGLADYVVSEDSDVLVYGAPLIRNISSRNEPLTLVYGSDVRTALDLDQDAFIDFAILLGTDFSQRIKNIGPIRAYRFIKEYGSIEAIIDGQPRFQPKIPQTVYLAQVESARAIFQTLPPIPDRLKILRPLPDQSKVSVIMERCGLGRALMVDNLWDYESALAGNYFGDDPAMITT